LENAPLILPFSAESNAQSPQIFCRHAGKDGRRPACAVGEGEVGPSLQAGAEDERRCPEEDVAAAEAALGAGEDEAEGEGDRCLSTSSTIARITRNG
jgi:hypothetical protein